MSLVRTLAVALILATLSPAARAGLYYSGETIAPLPSQWRGYLLDQRMLRNIAVAPMKGGPANPIRDHYRAAADQLEKASRDRKLTADEKADLGAIYIRLGDSAKAVSLLREAQRDHPKHFAIAANLGTGWQMQGDLNQAAAALEQAVRLAPAKQKIFEEHHLKLVRLRLKSGTSTELDDLFGVRYVGQSGKFEPGKMAASQSKKLPAEAAAIAQQLGLWLPADGLLLWQMAELANAFGDIRTAAAMMDGCVTAFNMNDPELQRRRRLTCRSAADALGKPAVGDIAKTEHQGHAGSFTPRSKRPLASHSDTADLPPINAKGINGLPWAVVAETVVDRRFKPTFAKYLKELDGKKVTLSGYMQPLGDDLEVTTFMFIEYPVGCWYCEMPESTNILFVQLPRGKVMTYSRSRVKVTGTLKLNDSDPEDFMYTIREAQVEAKE